MKPPMLQTAYKVVTTRNAYGDFIASTSVAIPCRFRNITEQVTGNTNEFTQSDAMAWFDASSGIEKEDILRIDDEHFRVERVIKARTLRSTTVQFIKVTLQKYGVIS